MSGAPFRLLLDDLPVLTDDQYNAMSYVYNVIPYLSYAINLISTSSRYNLYYIYL